MESDSTFVIEIHPRMSVWQVQSSGKKQERVPLSRLGKRILEGRHDLRE